jgi:hypothetical protein
MTTSELKDSGGRREFSTGSRRDKVEGKGRYDLFPPSAIKALCAVLEAGAHKYGANNWKLGQPISVYFDSMCRHIIQFWAGDVDEMHLHAAFWNAMAIIETQEMIQVGELPESLDDHPERGVAPLLLRCWRHIALPDNLDDCWEWQAGDNGNGYGIISFRKKKMYPHRVICEQVNGPQPFPDAYVLHSCDNRRCVNPKHLKWDTAAKNAAESVVRNGNVALSDAAQKFVRSSSIQTSELADILSTTPEIIQTLKELNDLTEEKKAQDNMWKYQENDERATGPKKTRRSKS